MKSKSVSAVIKMPLEDGGYTLAIRSPLRNSIDLRAMKMALIIAIKRLASPLVNEDDDILDKIIFKEMKDKQLQRASSDHWFFLSVTDTECSFDLEPLEYIDIQEAAKDIYLNFITGYLQIVDPEEK